MIMKKDSVTVMMVHDLQTNDAAIVKVELLTDEDYYEATADARRDSLDVTCGELGYKLALGRALRALSQEVLREANGMIRDHETIRLRELRIKEVRNADKAQRSEIAKAEGLALAAELKKQTVKDTKKKPAKKATVKKKPTKRK